MPRFCPKCGKEISRNETFCKECTEPSIEIKIPSLTICPTCRSIFSKNKWVKQDIHTHLKKHLEKFLGKDFKFEISEDMKIIQIKKGDELFVVPLKVAKEQCKRCSLAGSQYFEAVLQLRGVDENILTYIHRDIEKQAEKGVFVTKQEEVKGGADYYLTNQTYARNLGNKLLNEFGGVLKASEQLFSWDKQTGRNIFRLNVLYHPPKFKKGDIISFNNHLMKVTSIGKKLIGLDIIKNSRERLDYKGKEIKIHEIHSTLVSKTHPGTEIIHPKTFQSVAVENPKKLKVNDKVDVVIFKEKVYLV